MAAPSPSSIRTRRADPAAGPLTDPAVVPGDAVEDLGSPDDAVVPDEELLVGAEEVDLIDVEVTGSIEEAG